MKIQTISNNEGLNIITEKLSLFFEKNKDKPIEIEFKKIRCVRTLAQLRALYLWFDKISEEMNNQGFTITRPYKIAGVFTTRRWTKEDVKAIFKDILYALTKITTLSKLTKQALNECQDPFNECLATNWQIHIPFPSEEEQRILSLLQQNNENN